MKRKIYSELLRWKNEYSNKYAVLIDGARRVGKSYIVRQFAEQEYKSHIIIDFSNVTKSVKDLFENYLMSLDEFFMYLGLYYNVKLIPNETLIVFDEVQLYPKARAAIKHLVADGRFNYVETGSLVSINTNVKDIVIPSEEYRIKMYPMDFEEFLWAKGEDALMGYIRYCYENKKPLGDDMHRRAMSYFRQYMIVGGMPQAVQEYCNSGDFTRVDFIKRQIISLYRNDIKKYAMGYESKVGSIFDEMPGQLQKHEKKFSIASLKQSPAMRDYESSFFWLGESMVANLCYRSTAPNIGLRMNIEHSTLKCYMGDTGLLISHAFDEKHIEGEEIYKKLMLDKLEINKGMLVENIVAQMLVAAGHKLYFFSSYSPVAEDRMEIDFLISKSTITNRHNIIPIEVKSSKNYTLTSIKKFIKKYDKMLSSPIVIHSSDYKEDGGFVYLPLYMTPLL